MSSNSQDSDASFMRQAFEEAQKGSKEGGVPIGALLVHDGKVLGRGRNRRVQDGSVIKHAETDCLENAGRLDPEVCLQAMHAVLNMSPCSLCTGAVLLYNIPRVVVGENRNYTGAEQWLKHHGVEVVVVDDDDCATLMAAYIERNPVLWNDVVPK